MKLIQGHVTIQLLGIGLMILRYPIVTVHILIMMRSLVLDAIILILFSMSMRNFVDNVITILTLIITGISVFKRMLFMCMEVEANFWPQIPHQLLNMIVG